MFTAWGCGAQHHARFKRQLGVWRSRPCRSCAGARRGSRMPCSMALNAADDRRLSYSPRCAWHATQHAACFSCPCRSFRSCASARRSSRRRKRRRSSLQRSFRYVRANTRRAPRVPRVPRPGEADACVPHSPTHVDGARAHAAGCDGAAHCRGWRRS